MKANSFRIVSGYARMWPRAIFYTKVLDEATGHQKILGRGLDFLQGGGVYVLYRDENPLYVGQAKKLRGRLHMWATRPSAPQFHFWNYFSAFAVEDKALRGELEGVLIATLPGTNNGSKPKLSKAPIPKEVARLLRDAYSGVKQTC